MSVKSMAEKNLTGMVNKAYILMRDQASTGNMNSKVPYNGLGRVGESLAKAARKATDMDFTANTGQYKGYTAIKVQYNPSTLEFTSRGGTMISRYSGVGGDGTGSFQKANIPYEVVLNMDLIFDDTENSDAFSIMDAGSYSGTGAVKRVTSGLENRNRNGTFKKAHTVQDISELFVAAVTTPFTRAVCVIWNKTVFWGELCGVTVEYIMFNRVGNPIRSKVHLEIRQDTEKMPKAKADRWNAAYKDLFTTAEKLATDSRLSSTGNLASNLLNLS